MWSIRAMPSPELALAGVAPAAPDRPGPRPADHAPGRVAAPARAPERGAGHGGAAGPRDALPARRRCAWDRRGARLLRAHRPRVGPGAARVQEIRGIGGSDVIISKSIFVKRPVDRAFQLFTADIGKWWPLKEGLSFGADRADQI